MRYWLAGAWNFYITLYTHYTYVLTLYKENHEAPQEIIQNGPAIPFTRMTGPKFI